MQTNAYSVATKGLVGVSNDFDRAPRCRNVREGGKRFERPQTGHGVRPESDAIYSVIYQTDMALSSASDELQQPGQIFESSTSVAWNSILQIISYEKHKLPRS